MTDQVRLLVQSLDTLCDYIEAQAFAQADNRRDNGGVVGVFVNVPQEGPVNFYNVDRELFQVRERRIAGPKIVESDANPAFAEGPQALFHVFRAASEEYCLCNLDLETRPGKRVTIEETEQTLSELLLFEIGGQDW